jgi:hypothetical protein
MQPASKKRTTARIWFYVASALLVVSVWGVQTYGYHQFFKENTVLYGAPDPPPALSDWQKMSAQSMSDLNGLLTTLATAMLGAIGFLMSSRAQEGSVSRHLWAALLGATGGGLSLYCGYVAHVNLLRMSIQFSVDPYDLIYRSATNAQFYSLLAGAFFFADFAVHGLSVENPDKEESA